MVLHETLVSELTDLHAKLSDNAELLPLPRLEQSYETFRKRFGPEILRGLDGERLLETMHGRDANDSLVYWLEFKNDEELPAVFGSIAGGSALKFGLFQRKETGQWTTGTTKKMEVIPTAQAVEIARRQRDELLQGVELLAAFPDGASGSEYERLQQQMDEVAPDVSQKAWGHKYFSLLFPEKLDDFHNAYYQRFHLITLLQKPRWGDLRYANAGLYVAIAKTLGWPVNHLTSVLNRRNGRPYRHWRLGTSDGTKPRNVWELMVQGSCVAVGWPRIRNLSDISWNAEGKETVRRLMQEHYPNTPRSEGDPIQQLFHFVTHMEEGDFVAAADGQTILGVGKVTGGYEYEANSDFPHRHPVAWVDVGEWTLPKSTEGRQATVYEFRKNMDNRVAIERRVLERPSKPLTPRGPIGKPPKLEGVPGRIQSALDRKRQVVLYGPPGTGKTYWAEKTARDLASYSRFGRGFEDLDGSQRKNITGGADADGLVRLCTFHPAYGYEDFLEGYRPEEEEGQLVFRLRDGIFKTLCQDAANQPNDHHYLIIDEINRGDIPRIFGELLTLLEKDKRGMEVLLPLSGETFQVPDNVFVIGTMNTADRSIALLDTALRRRFGFVELMPDATVLRGAVLESIPLGPWLKALNQKICEHIGRDARNLQIGHAYLLEGGQPVSSFGNLQRVLQDDIVPLLEEYCYEDYSALAKILGKGLVDESAQRIRHEMFAPERRDDLVQALKAIEPALDTTPEALRSDTEEGEDGSGDEEEEDEPESLHDEQGGDS